MSPVAPEAEALYGLAYLSRARPETIARMDEAFPGILRDAQARNVAFGVTGALLACDGWFLQFLEGPRCSVLQAFGRIRNDHRHGSIRVIEAGPIPSRQFSCWSMCGRRLSPTDDAILTVLDTHNAFDPAAMTRERALALLRSVQKVQKEHARDNPEYV